MSTRGQQADSGELSPDLLGPPRLPLGLWLEALTAAFSDEVVIQVSNNPHLLCSLAGSGSRASHCRRRTRG